MKKVSLFLVCAVLSLSLALCMASCKSNDNGDTSSTDSTVSTLSPEEIGDNVVGGLFDDEPVESGDEKADVSETETASEAPVVDTQSDIDDDKNWTTVIVKP